MLYYITLYTFIIIVSGVTEPAFPWQLHYGCSGYNQTCVQWFTLS